MAAAVTAAFWVSRTLPGVSPAAAAVAGGIALANLGGLRDSFRPGLRLASRRMLRLAIVLLGLQIALPEVLALGGRTLALVAVATGVTFAVTRWAGPRLGVDARRSLLIATGVSVCGAAAIAAMHEVAGSDDDDAASAVGVVVLYGSAAIVVLPALGGLLDLSPHQLGLWAGAAVHEVAQVAAIGAAAGTGVLAGAVVVKLARVLLLAPIVALTSAGLRRAATRQARRAALARTGESRGAADARGERTRETAGMRAEQTRETAGMRAERTRETAGMRAEQTRQAADTRAEQTRQAGAGRRPPAVPPFVAAFVAMVALRATGAVPEAITRPLPEVTGVLLAAALFALGAGVDLRRLLRGGRALLLGGVATAVIGVISLLGVLAIG
ncbi:YeiH family protein [Planobispora longispora]|uniref:Sulfate exporter family transporter n=1 Tax=Planobispora longispora TaxID=28887 RepID=A0A8J3RTW5_9ACTN|nr:putative sulfate exporter family transporter [Planobispora longispora]GIH79494.1 hypothetical protein Plo01_59230 [Planobispora longispora]